MKLFSFFLSLLLFNNLYSQNSEEGVQGHSSPLKPKFLTTKVLSIIDPKEQISDFEAKFELAKLLSHQEKSREEALQQYIMLLKEKPLHAPLRLEISRLYIAEGNFILALDLLQSLVSHKPMRLNLQEIKERRIVANPTKAVVSETLVDTNPISDDKARLELARLLARQESELNEAISFYKTLLKKHPVNSQLVLEISQLYLQQKKYLDALSYLYPALRQHSRNSKLLIEAARAELGLEHPKKSHELLLRASAISNETEAILMDEASVYMMVGSFYKAIAIYTQALNNQPQSLDLALKLAWTFVSAQRYEEAEGIYRRLLIDHPNHPKVLEAIVVLKMIEKDFTAALEVISCLSLLFQDNPNYLELKAEALFKNEEFPEALEAFDSLSRYPKFSSKALIGKGRINLLLGRCDEAQESFQKAYEQDSLSIKAQFYRAGLEVFKKEFIQEVIDRLDKPNALVEWGNLFAENGMGGMAEFYEAALKLDPDYFPAQIGLASALSNNYEYEKAVDIYLSILNNFPHASKIMIEVARVLSWSKSYENSMDWYEQITALDPTDPLPVKERARVAYWGKFFEQSMQTYGILLKQPVDQILLNALQGQNLCITSQIFSSLQKLSQLVEEGSTYQGYEAFYSEWTGCGVNLEFEEKKIIDRILTDIFPQYRIQKAIQLESQAKALDWQGNLLHALNVYQELADFNPGNQEGLYGYAQDFCALGLCKCSRTLYLHLLHQDPNNNLVKMALGRNLLRESPLLQCNYNFWTEQGSGQFANSQIARHQFEEIFEWSPQCNEHFRFIQNEWVEYPFFTQKYYPAEGQTIEINKVFSGYVRGVASGTRKNYFNKFPSRFSCLGTLWFNLQDYFNLGVGFERKNEIYNYFTLKQGIQAKAYWTSLRATSHTWDLMTTYRHLDYNDHNSLDHCNLLVSYTLTEDPLVFKLILDSSYRNTAHITEFIINSSGQLVDVIHPYWTPRNYYSGSVTLEFRYNYAWFTYCEAPQTYVDIKLTGETDTTHNPSIQLAINWKHEFMRHWGFEITGLYHRSKLWDADQLSTQIYYRF